jgi:hypothetical protein
LKDGEEEPPAEEENAEEDAKPKFDIRAFTWSKSENAKKLP